ncbi:MAG: hypothetical protein Q4A78_04745 [Peptostreptococcaceae bacterium]|nr:hypothetical protein [Peptostreptococcaceae bacterium]
MKKAGVCPKCGSKDILWIPGKAGPYGSGNNIPCGLTTMSAILVNRYVCEVCGFSEEWVDVHDIPKLKKKYDK